MRPFSVQPFAIAAALLVRAATAATFQVTNANPTGPGSFYQAILDANASGAAAVIEFLSDSQLGTSCGGNKLPAITVPVTINGHGRAVSGTAILVISTGPSVVRDLSFTAIYASPAVSITSSTVIDGCTITGVHGACEGGVTAVEILGSGNAIRSSTLKAQAFRSTTIFANGNDNQIGGSGVGNVIQSNCFGLTCGGVSLTGQRNVIESNSISGVGEGDGIRIAGDDNRVAGNTINLFGCLVSCSGGPVHISSGVRDTIQKNIITDSRGGPLAIKVDPGANGNLAAPIIQNALVANGVASIVGTAQGPANSPLAVELFRNTGCPSTSSGNAERFVASTNVITDAGGQGTFVFSFAETCLYCSVVATATDQSGNTSSSSADVCIVPAVPVITSVAPTSGPVGTSLTITGTYFSGATDVRIGNTSAPFTVNSDSKITATVPANATSGFVTVTTPTGTGGSSIRFLVTPAITGFSPTSGAPGTTVTITGTTLSDTFAVTFNNVLAVFVVIDSTTLKAAVPAGATTGPIEVTTQSGTARSATEFVVPCSYIINPMSASFSAAGGTGSVAIAAPAGCVWGTSSNVNWVTITSGSSGTGDGTVSYVVASNPGAARTGVLYLAGQVFTVVQAGLNCSYSVTPTSSSYSAAGGTGSIAITAPAGCVWGTSSNANWVTIASGSSGTGDGTVSYLVAPNSGAARTGILYLAGQIFTVNQSSCSTSVPTIVAPSSNASTMSPVSFRWTLVAEAIRYRVWLTDASGEMTLFATTTETLTIMRLNPGSYEWYVEAFFDGCPSTRSVAAKFQVVPPRRRPAGRR